MAEDQAAPWDANTDGLITNLDKQITKEYGLSLRELLLTPEKFAGQKDALQNAEKIRDYVSKYFSGVKDGMKDEQAEFTKELENADAQSAKIEEVISTKAALARIPFIKPYYVDFDPARKEEITVDKYDNSVDALIAKLVNVSDYVSDMSGIYGKYVIGSWLFSGRKAYVISVYLEESIISSIDRMEEDLDSMIETAYQSLKLVSRKQ
jgi:hypothetical protein